MKPPQSIPETHFLKGRRVVVTRRSSQSSDLVGRLEQLGASVINLPTIEVVDPESWEPMDRALADIESFDWLVFTSANAVTYLHKRLIEVRPEALESAKRITTCAIGAATCRAAEEAGLPVSLVPQDSHAEGLLQSIIEYAGGEEALPGLRFLLPRSNIARETLVDGLSRHGAIVNSVEAYRTVLPATDLKEVMATLADPIDAITFTSPSTVQNLAVLVGTDRFKEFFGSALAVCIGPVTAQAAIEAGLRNVVYPNERSLESLINEIVAGLG